MKRTTRLLSNAPPIRNDRPAPAAAQRRRHAWIMPLSPGNCFRDYCLQGSRAVLSSPGFVLCTGNPVVSFWMPVSGIVYPGVSCLGYLFSTAIALCNEIELTHRGQRSSTQIHSSGRERPADIPAVQTSDDAVHAAMISTE